MNASYVTLIPKRPPGRRNRKALGFTGEIRRLHLEGYSCDAIREALGDAGVTVSRSTVIREVGRLPKDTPVRPALRAAESGAFNKAVAAAPQPMHDGRTGREIAAAWMSGRVTNPLLRSRSKDEGSGH